MSRYFSGRGSARMLPKLRVIRCRRKDCSRHIYLCRRCDRLHRYCCEDCRNLARQVSKRRARQKYARSPHGRYKNRQRQRRWRERKRLKQKRNKKNVTDHSSQGRPKVVGCVSRKKTRHVERKRSGFSSFWETDKSKIARCHGCGRWGRVVFVEQSRGRFRQQDS